MKFYRPILISVVAHLAIVAALLSLPAKETQRSSSQIVIFEVVPQREASRGVRKDSSPSTDIHNQSLRRFLPRFTAHPGKAVDSTDQSVPEDQWGGGNSDLLHHVQSASELQKLAEELNGSLSYPSVLAKRRISGTISAQLYFSKSGGCDPKRTKVLPGELYLRTYVIALLKKVCGFEQIEKMRLHSSDHVDISFSFRLVGLDEKHETPAEFSVGNVLAFEREAIKPFGEVKLGPLALTPLSLSVDFLWFAEQWDRAHGKKDPLDEFRE
jgi:hypothetical protein